MVEYNKINAKLSNLQLSKLKTAGKSNEGTTLSYGGSSNSVPQTTVKFSNEEINNMIKIVKALEDSDVLMKGSAETLQNDVK